MHNAVLLRKIDNGQTRWSSMVQFDTLIDMIFWYMFQSWLEYTIEKYHGNRSKHEQESSATYHVALFFYRSMMMDDKFLKYVYVVSIFQV